MATPNPTPPALDTSEASVEEAHWPPARVASIWKEPEQGEGKWTVPDMAWLRRESWASASDAPSPFYKTFVRPDEERPYSKVLLVAMDMRQLEFATWRPAVEDPKPLTGPHGPGASRATPPSHAARRGRVQRRLQDRARALRDDGAQALLLPPLPGGATVVVLEDGRVGSAPGADHDVGGIRRRRRRRQSSRFRQNLDPLLDRDEVNPTGRALWGLHAPGHRHADRALGPLRHDGGHLVYAWGDDVSATTLAKAIKLAGCDYAHAPRHEPVPHGLHLHGDRRFASTSTSRSS